MLALRDRAVERSALLRSRRSDGAELKLSDTSALALEMERSISLTRLKLPA